jgi:hypothetical protein
MAGNRPESVWIPPVREVVRALTSITRRQSRDSIQGFRRRPTEWQVPRAAEWHPLPNWEAAVLPLNYTRGSGVIL